MVESAVTAPTITTNNVGRFLLTAAELTEGERAEHDVAADSEREFVRYRGDLIPLDDFSNDYGITRGSGLPSVFAGWDAYLSDSFWTGLVLRFVREGDRIDTERVVVGRFVFTD